MISATVPSSHPSSTMDLLGSGCQQILLGRAGVSTKPIGLKWWFSYAKKNRVLSSLLVTNCFPLGEKAIEMTALECG